MKITKYLMKTQAHVMIRIFLSRLVTLHSVRFLGIFVQFFFFIQKAVILSSKSLLALTKQVSTCFEDFMNIS